jgi:hypothetical protein
MKGDSEMKEKEIDPVAESWKTYTVYTDINCQTLEDSREDRKVIIEHMFETSNENDMRTLARLVNDENIDVLGKFEAKEYLIARVEEYNEEHGTDLKNIEWSGKGVYAAHGARFGTDYVCAIEDIMCDELEQTLEYVKEDFDRVLEEREL